MMWMVGCRKWMLSGVLKNSRRSACIAIDQQLQALDLDGGAGKAVDNHAVVICGAQQLAQQQADGLAVADHVARVLERSRLGRVEQRAHDDRAAGQAARLGDERRVGALAGAGRAAEQNDLLRETQVLAAEAGFEILPDGFEDQLRVFDLEIAELDSGRFSTLLAHEGQRERFSATHNPHATGSNRFMLNLLQARSPRNSIPSSSL